MFPVRGFICTTLAFKQVLIYEFRQDADERSDQEQGDREVPGVQELTGRSLGRQRSPFALGEMPFTLSMPVSSTMMPP
ncbi:hypothetical protein BDS110ZK17_23860 [Bradyrhizobium diazoefficiens]|nr:hypothetical protein XF16B_45630 [Bradyrhizobium diazoefficiens]BCF70216.1 hypothetical protein XF19B_45690 [Bradyrhizobium diazoefficiens]